MSKKWEGYHARPQEDTFFIVANAKISDITKLTQRILNRKLKTHNELDFSHHPLTLTSFLQLQASLIIREVLVDLVAYQLLKLVKIIHLHQQDSSNQQLLAKWEHLFFQNYCEQKNPKSLLLVEENINVIPISRKIFFQNTRNMSQFSIFSNFKPL